MSAKSRQDQPRRGGLSSTPTATATVSPPGTVQRQGQHGPQKPLGADMAPIDQLRDELGLSRDASEDQVIRDAVHELRERPKVSPQPGVVGRG